jgi:hypothetical protein
MIHKSKPSVQKERSSSKPAARKRFPAPDRVAPRKDPRKTVVAKFRGGACHVLDKKYAHRCPKCCSLMQNEEIHITLRIVVYYCTNCDRYRYTMIWMTGRKNDYGTHTYYHVSRPFMNCQVLRKSVEEFYAYGVYEMYGRRGEIEQADRDLKLSRNEFQSHYEKPARVNRKRAA